VKKASKRVHTQQPTDKGTCQLYHAKRRARERIGFNLSDERYALLVHYIKEGKSDDDICVQFLSRQSKRVRKYSIKIKGIAEFNVLFDRDRNSIVTLLFPEVDQQLSHYIDVFGNSISLRDAFGYAWTIHDGVLCVPTEDVTVIGPDEWEVGFISGPKTFVLKNKWLYEKGPFGIY
jgi:hypothetical protein